MQFSVRLLQCAKQLHEASIDLDRDQPVAAGVECVNGRCVALQTALERERGLARKPECEIPDWRDHGALEYDANREGRSKCRDATTEHRPQQQSGSAESDKDAEDHARRHQREQRIGASLPRRAAVRGVGVTGMRMANVRMANVRMANVRMANVRMANVRMAVPARATAERHRNHADGACCESRDVEIHCLLILHRCEPEGEGSPLAVTSR
jgi:hypothetical protein